MVSYPEVAPAEDSKDGKEIEELLRFVDMEYFIESVGINVHMVRKKKVSSLDTNELVA